MPHLFDAASYTLTLYSLPTLLTMLAIFLLGILALVHERISAVSISFFLVTLAVSLWLLAQTFLYSSSDEAVALWWARAAYLGVPFIASSTYHFTTAVLKIYNRFRPVVVVAWILAACFSGLAIGTNALFSDLYHYSWGPYARYSWLGLPFILFFSTLLLANMAHYFSAYRTSPSGTHKRRISSLMIAFAVGYIGAFDFIPAYGINLYPFGYFAILGFVVLGAHSIFAYRLVDITPAFAANEIINTMNDALLVLDASGIIRLVNGAAVLLLRRSEGELIGKPVSSTLKDPLFTDPVQFNNMIKAGSISSYELTYFTNPRSEASSERCFSLSASVKPWRDEEPAAIVCIIRDITARKRVEAQLSRQNEYLAALHETSLGLVKRLELTGLLESILQRAASLVEAEHGYIYVVENGANGPELVLQVSKGHYGQNAGERLQYGEGLAGTVWKRGETITVADYQTWPSSSPRFKRANLRAVIGIPLRSAGQLTGVLGLAHVEEGRVFDHDEEELLGRFAELASIALDNARLYSAARQELVERQRAEMEITRLNRNLERRVAERTSQLEAALKELEAFSYSVSHDLRAPLRAVTGFSNAVLEDYGDTLEPTGQRYLRLIRDSAQNMGQLIDDLLTFSRVGRQQMGKSEVDMAQLAADVWQDVQGANPEHPIHFTVGDLPPAQGDRSLLRQVFANLLQNGEKFTRNRVDSRIEVGCEQRGEENVYYVRDNGAGFDMRYVHKLFGVFQRLHSTSEFEGTGVGLALVQRIVVRHGGRVWAEGIVNRGATFYFALPAAVPATMEESIGSKGTADIAG